MKLTARPTHLSSWSFRVCDDLGTETRLNVGWWRERGHFDYDGRRYELARDGLFGTTYTMSVGHSVAAAANKRLLARCFSIETQDRSLRLQPETFFTRGFAIYESDKPVGAILPDGMFTRKSTITTTIGLSVPETLFLFWLVVLDWRRAAASATA